MPNSFDDSLANNGTPANGRKPRAKKTPELATADKNRSAAAQRRQVADVALSHAENLVEQVEA